MRSYDERRSSTMSRRPPRPVSASASRSGLWMPISLLPRWLQHIAPWLPTYHLAQLMLGVMGYAQPEAAMRHLFALIGFALLFLGCAWIAFARSETNA